ncbi:MAG TPA: site-2 protease family protein [Pyrinomonadaceae bacterium]|nr:site-2 protease family protein [Pyrinomonadaceae bacterium]
MQQSITFESSTPSARELRLHGGLLLLTIVTTTVAGIMLAAPEIEPAEPPLSSVLDYVFYIPLAYFYELVALLQYAFAHPRLITEGATFSASLLAILFSHEMGHYLACRYYKVNATLPYFIPAPPVFLAGTFGAFIKIRSAIPTRRALFDIGLAGPLAGFVVALPLSVIGILTVGPPLSPQDHAIFFNDPLLFRLFAKLLGVNLDPNSAPNPYYMAAWLGLLVTSLNLMPVGQLDGGHGTFALFGARVHRIIGRLAFISVSVLAVLGLWWHGSPSGFLYAVLLAIMMKVPHPQPMVMEPLGTKRIVIAIITLAVFILCFWPFPITIT